MDREVFNPLMERAHKNQVNLKKINDTVQHLDKREFFTEVYKNLNSLAINVFRNIYEDEKGIHTETFTVPVAGLNDFMPILAESVYNNDAILASCVSDLTLIPKR